MPLFFIDYWYVILVVPMIIFSLIMSANVKSTYSKYVGVRCRSGITGAEAARRILLANGITDTPVTMAAKAHLRCSRPLVIALASNDALSANLKNIAIMAEKKNVYFVPMKQDDIENKPYSLVADFHLIEKTLAMAEEGRQIRPLFI